jgi:hypothetical protein
MRRPFPRLLTRAAAAFFTVAAAGQADTTDQTIRLSWVRSDEAAACPDAQIVMDRVRTRLGKDPFSERARTAAEVLVERNADGFVAHVRVRSADGTLAGERTLRSSESCDTLASAVAFALALFIDPNAALGPPAVPAPVQPEPSRPTIPSPAAPPPAVPLPAVPLPAVPPPVSPPAQSSPPDFASPSVRQPTAVRASIATAAGALVAPGLLPGAGWGPLLRAEVEVVARVSLGGQAVLLPEERTSDGEFGFGVSAMGARGCVDILSNGVLRLAPCAGVWAGEIYAVVFPKTLLALPPGGRAWGSAEVSARARLRIVGPLFAEVEGGIFIPFARYPFSVKGQVNAVFQESAVVPTGSLALGVSFP